VGDVGPPLVHAGRSRRAHADQVAAIARIVAGGLLLLETLLECIARIRFETSCVLLMNTNYDGIATVICDKVILHVAALAFSAALSYTSLHAS
jgi:hypothetical protein